MSAALKQNLRFDTGDDESLQATVQRFIGCEKDSRLLANVTEATMDLKRRLRQLVECAEIETVLEKEIEQLEAGKMPEKRAEFDVLVQCEDLNWNASEQQEESTLVFPAHLSFRERREYIRRHATKLNRELDLKIVRTQMQRCEDQTTSDAFLRNCKAIVDGARVDREGVDKPSATLTKLKGLLPDGREDRYPVEPSKLEKLHRYLIEKLLSQQEKVEEERRKQEKARWAPCADGVTRSAQRRIPSGADGAAGLPPESPRFDARHGYASSPVGSPRGANGYDLRNAQPRIPSGYAGYEASLGGLAEDKALTRGSSRVTGKPRSSAKPSQKSPGKKSTKGDNWQVGRDRGDNWEDSD